MPKQVLTPAHLHEVRSAMTGLSGANAKAEAMRLAAQRGVHWSRIYDATKDLRPRRKPRTDKGKRRVDLREHAGMSLATSQVVANNLNPELALELARASGHETPISVATFRRQLREGGMNRRQLRSSCVVHRRFEAKAPGEVFQFDITGLKTRWLDTRTRRLVYVPKSEVGPNHPNKKPQRVQVWAFVCIDDFSRYIFVRFIATSNPNSSDVIDFELECFRHMGVPLSLYTDNDSKIVSQWNLRAASILDNAFAENGGFKLEQHMPENPNATGKVERAHQVIEEFEKLLGCCPEPPAEVEALNLFAQRFCDRKNWTIHRSTRMKPAIRFRSGTGVMRVAPDEILDSAFKARDIPEVKVNSDVTISVDGVRWQLPRGPRVAFTLRGAQDIANPFPDLAIAEKSIRVVWPREADWFMAIAGGHEFELVKQEAVADAAGEFKSVAQSNAEANRTHFKAKAAEVKKAAKEAIKRGEPSPIVVPGPMVPFEIAAEARPEIFPRQQVSKELAEWAAHAGQPSIMNGRPLGFFEALGLLIDEEVLTASDADKGWLRTVFNGRDLVGEAEIRTVLDAREEMGRLLEMRSA